MVSLVETKTSFGISMHTCSIKTSDHGRVVPKKAVFYMKAKQRLSSTVKNYSLLRALCSLFRKKALNRPFPLVTQGAKVAKETFLKSRERAAFQKGLPSLTGCNSSPSGVESFWLPHLSSGRKNSSWRPWRLERSGRFVIRWRQRNCPLLKSVNQFTRQIESSLNSSAKNPQPHAPPGSRRQRGSGCSPGVFPGADTWRGFPGSCRAGWCWRGRGRR